MLIPPEITVLVERLNRELDRILQEVTQGLNLATAILGRFPNNFAVIQLSAFLNTAMFFVDTSRRRIQTIIENISAA